MRHLEILYNPETVDTVIEFFKPPPSEADSINALLEAAGDTLEGLAAQTRAGLEYALEEHKRLDLRVDMDAPVMIFPERCVHCERSCPIQFRLRLTVNILKNIAARMPTHLLQCWMSVISLSRVIWSRRKTWLWWRTTTRRHLTPSILRGSKISCMTDLLSSSPALR